jgi:GT2 family glycosyltransferase
LTVTTVLYNSQQSIARYAETLRPSLESGLVQLVAVDNASPDDSAALLVELLPAARVITNETNLGFAAGCNRSWPLVNTRYWLLLNPDVDSSVSGLQHLVQWMDDRPDVGVASPRLRDSDGKELPVARAHDSLWRPLVELLRLHKLLPELLRSRLLLSGRRDSSELIRGWVSGAAMIVRSRAVAEVGLLDEDLFLYGEDREWCWRMAHTGWGIGVCSDVEFRHAGGVSALATWDHEERVRREVMGHLKAAARMRGPYWTRLFAAVVWLTLGLESVDRRRDASTRDEARLRSRLYRDAIRGGIAR